MCKKHYDGVIGVKKLPRGKKQQQHAGSPVMEGGGAEVVGGGGRKNRGRHERGLSMFQDDDLMNTILNNGAPLSSSSTAENDGLRGLSIDAPI